MPEVKKKLVPFCLNVRATDKYRIQEKGKRTKATKRHILDDDADLRSHMACEGKVLTFNIGGVKHFSGKWSSTGRDAQRESLARRCMSEKCQSQKKHRESATERKPCFLADLTADMLHRPQLDILHPQTCLQEGPKKLLPVLPAGGCRRNPCSYL